MQCEMCTVKCVLCCMKSEVFSVKCVESSVQYEVISVQCEVCSVQCSSYLGFILGECVVRSVFDVEVNSGKTEDCVHQAAKENIVSLLSSSGLRTSW